MIYSAQQISDVSEQPDRSGYNPERALWRSVLLQMIQDMKSDSPKPEARAAKAAAHSWFNTKSFYLVCDYADYEPEYVRRMIKLAKERNFQWRLPDGQGWRVQKRILRNAMEAV